MPARGRRPTQARTAPSAPFGSDPGWVCCMWCSESKHAWRQECRGHGGVSREGPGSNTAPSWGSARKDARPLTQCEVGLCAHLHAHLYTHLHTPQHAPVHTPVHADRQTRFPLDTLPPSLEESTRLHSTASTSDSSATGLGTARPRCSLCTRCCTLPRVKLPSELRRGQDINAVRHVFPLKSAAYPGMRLV